MFSKLHERLGTAGLVVAVVALVAALAGTAFAAAGLNSKQKQQVTAIAKQYAGKQGPPGPQGTAGTNGKDGANGTNGTNGTSGTNGVSPTGTAFSGNAHGCTEGGVEFKGTNTTAACNGVKGTNGTNGKNVVTGTEPTGTSNCEERGGATVEVQGEPSTKKFACNGKEGSPWVAGHAPTGAILKGTWAIQGYAATGAGEVINVPISTGVPVEIPETKAIMLQKGTDLPGETTEERESKEGVCPGEADNPLPSTLPGGGFKLQICIYVKEASNLAAPPTFMESIPLSGSGGGVMIEMKSNAAGTTKADGSWVLTAE